MRIAWVEVAGEEQFTVPDDLLGLVPGDCVGVSLRGQVRRMRITGQEITPGTIRLRMMNDRQSAYTSNVTGVPVPLPTPPLPTVVGQTIYSYLDIPALNDGNDRLGRYDAATDRRRPVRRAERSTQRRVPTSSGSTPSPEHQWACGRGTCRRERASTPTPPKPVASRIHRRAIDALTDRAVPERGGGYRAGERGRILGADCNATQAGTRRSSCPPGARAAPDGRSAQSSALGSCCSTACAWSTP